MANVAMLWRKPTDAGTWSQGSWATTLPLVNLAERDIQRVARTTSAAAASTRFRVDCGSDFSQFNAFALLNHNATTAATWRIVVTTDATDADAAARTLDTGALPMWQANVIFGSLPWGAFPWNHIDPAGFPAGTLALQLLPAPVLGRYVWVYITDTANPAGYLQAGRFLAGAAWQPGVNMDFGIRERWVDLGEVTRTRGGARIAEQRPRFREVDLTFSALTEDEAFGGPFDMAQQLGKAGDFLLIVDPAATPAIASRRTIYAALKETTPVIHAAFQRWSWTLTAEELI